MLKRLVAAAVAAMLFIGVVAHAVPESWPSVLANILQSEGGNDDDKADPGGRTSRGIIQREWNAWRVHHPGLPADVWDAPDDQVAAIYEERYWLHRCVRGDLLPAGIDYSVADYGVNAGVDRAGKVLRRLLLGNDGGRCDVSDGLIALIRSKPPEKVIRAIADERRRFYANLIAARPSLGKFRNGWMKRATAVERISLKKAGIPVLGLFGEELEVVPAFGPGKAYVR